MFSSDACCFRNGQLKQFNDGEGWGKQKHFIQAKTLEKIYANQNENKKNPENPTPHPFIYHFSPFVYLLSITNGAPSTYLVQNFVSLLTAVNALFFTQKSISEITCTQTLIYFSFRFYPLGLVVNKSLRFIFYNLRSTNFEEAISKTERVLDFSKPYHSSISPIGPFNRPK